MLMYRIAYTPVGQEVSFSNYWKGKPTCRQETFALNHNIVPLSMAAVSITLSPLDPNHQDLYYQHCNFLPALDKATNTSNPQSAS